MICPYYGGTREWLFCEKVFIVVYVELEFGSYLQLCFSHFWISVYSGKPHVCFQIYWLSKKKALDISHDLGLNKLKSPYWIWPRYQSNIFRSRSVAFQVLPYFIRSYLVLKSPKVDLFFTYLSKKSSQWWVIFSIHG